MDNKTLSKELASSLDILIEQSSHPNTKVYGTGLWRLCHQLAAEGYQPAKDFFIRKLDDSRWDWRKVSVQLLGFHFQLDEKTIEKIRKILLSDLDSGVRIAAAGNLGKQSKFPDQTLIHALKFDPNELVREAAFSAILELSGITYKKKMRELAKVRSREINPNLDQLKRILVEENLKTKIDMLEE
jgi:hypothetical protein